MSHLIVESGADKRKIFQLSTDREAVGGRGSHVDILINDPFVSSKHFSLAHKNGTWLLTDLNSANGIELNEKKLTEPTILRDNDLIRLGSTYLRFLNAQNGNDTATQALAVPQISGYKLGELLGIGGMGEVYRATQLSLDRPVAIKILFAKLARDEKFVERFFQEARAAGNLNHPHIVQVHDVGRDGDHCYICMEYVSGGTLTDLLRKTEIAAEKTAIKTALDVAQGLAYAQSRKLVHCDIKPDNIMFAEDGTAKIADLGIAKQTSDVQTQTAEVSGSPHYMSPEQAMGKPLDHRTDLYSLGCTLYRMLAGRTPFAGTSAREVMKKQVTEEPPELRTLNPQVSARLANIIAKLMAKKPEQRLSSAEELIKLLADKTLPVERPAKAKTKSINVAARSGVAANDNRELFDDKAAMEAPAEKINYSLVGQRYCRYAQQNKMTILVAAAVLIIFVFVGKWGYREIADRHTRNAYEQAVDLKLRREFAEALKVLKAAPAARNAQLQEQVDYLRLELKKKIRENQSGE